MRTATVAFLASAAVAAALTPVVRGLARRWNVLDHARTTRKVHGKPIPRVGGVAIVGAFFAPLTGLLFVDSDVGGRFTAHPNLVLGLFAGGLAIAALGLYDDLRGADARTKFTVQFAVAALVYALGFRIDFIANPFGGAPVVLGPMALPFTMLWIVGLVNAMNLIDGLDGLAGGVAFAAIAATFAIAVLHGQPLMVLFAGALGGAVLGFLFYNVNPATIFMGDTGSMFLGFVLATTAIQTNQKSATVIALVVPIVALGVPIADTLLAMARRAARGAPLFSADRGHIHHRLLSKGLSHRQSVLVLWAVSALLGLGAVLLSLATSAQGTALVAGLAALALWALRALGYLDLRKVESLLEERRRNALRRAAVRTAASALRDAPSHEAVWAAVRTVAAALGAGAVGLRLSPGGAWEDGLAEVEAGVLRTRFPLRPDGPGADELELAWNGGREHLDRDTEIALEQVCELVAASVDRLRAAGRASLPVPASNG
jgi:UDP-GlcNAc:undecaprenyl-phosphate GlcNAc-1-phosphate transferase